VKAVPSTRPDVIDLIPHQGDIFWLRTSAQRCLLAVQDLRATQLSELVFEPIADIIRLPGKMPAST